MLGLLARVLVDIQPIEALRYTDSTIQCSRRRKDKIFEINAIHIKGYIYTKMGKRQKAIEIYQETTQKFKETKQWTAYAFAEIDLGNVYYSQKLYNLAKLHYQYAHTAFEKGAKDMVDLGKALIESNIGLIYSELKNFKQALIHFKKALKLRKKIQSQYLVSHSLRNIASVYEQKGFIDSAIINYQNALDICKELKAKTDISSIYLHISNIYYSKENISNALHYAKKSLENSCTNNTDEIYVEALLTTGKYYQIAEKVDSAISLYETAFQIAEKFNLQEQELIVCEKLEKLFKAEKNCTKQIFYLEKITQLQRINNNEQILKNQLEYEFNQYQNETTAYETNFKRQRFVIFIVVSALLLSLVMSLLLAKSQIRIRKNNKILEQKNVEIQEKSLALENANIQLIQLDEYKQKLTAIMVHDLKNPLSAIIGFAQLKDITREKQIILHAAYEMMNQIMNILYIQKFNEKSIQSNFKDTKVCEIFQTVFYQMQYSFEVSEVSFSYDKNSTIVAFCDAILLERVLINLLSNAVKYCQKGTIDLSVGETETGVRISVSDNGIGISEEKQKNIFIESSNFSNKEDGQYSTKFGLPFCKKVIDLHSGQIGVNSQIGFGTEFWFLLPKKEFQSQ